METAKLVFEKLRELGLMPEVLEGIGCRFEYRQITMAYLSNENDENFLQFAVTGILDVGEENREDVLRLLGEANNALKVVKAVIFREDEVWLFYEHFTENCEELDYIIPQIVRSLYYSYQYFGEKLSTVGETGSAEEVIEGDVEMDNEGNEV